MPAAELLDNHFSPQSITALVLAVTGGSRTGSIPAPGIGVYRPGPALVTFFGKCNVQLHIVNQARVPAVCSRLEALNRDPGGSAALKKLFEAAANEAGASELRAKAADYLNAALLHDGLQLRWLEDAYQLTSIGTNSALVAALQEALDELDLDSVRRDFHRALDSVVTDPEDAITAACSMLESVCKTILTRMGQPLPERQVVEQLVEAALKQLDLAPRGQTITQPEADDMHQMLRGLRSVVHGVGALRTHVGDAHGRADGASRMDGRTARLAIHAASTLALFLIETWQQNDGQQPA